jgi:two-component system NtrC family sensor kinase
MEPGDIDGGGGIAALVGSLWPVVLPFLAGSGAALTVTLWLIFRMARTNAWLGAAVHEGYIQLSQRTHDLALARAELDGLQRQLEHSERVASLGTLAAGAAHEINNPLTVVGANLSMLSEELPAPGDFMDFARHASLTALLADAAEGTFRAGRIVRDLKAFVSPHTEDTELVELALSVSDTVRMLSPLLRSRAILEEIHEPAPAVRASRIRLYQVLVNVLRNAVEALPEGREGNRIVVRTGTSACGAAFVRVEDNGPGIPEDTLSHVFEPFFTTKAPGVGTGLGLPVSSGIVTALGGRIDVENRLGEGVAFVIHLPAAMPLEHAVRSARAE